MTFLGGPASVGASRLRGRSAVRHYQMWTLTSPALATP